MTKTKALKFTLAASKEGTLMKLSGTNYWAVAEPFFWYVDYEDHSKGMIMVPRGFNTDMGSIPRALWLVFNPTEWLAFVLHDYLYKTQVIEGRKIERIEADTIMKEALISEGCVNPELFCLYAGVRLGGASRFEENSSN